MSTNHSVSHKHRAYAHIREKMLLGGFMAGSRLSEVALAKEIGVSRTPVREAMAQLTVEGLIDYVPRLGSFVRKLDRRELQELYEIREVLEGYAARRAAERITPEQLNDMRGLCDGTHAIVCHFRDASRLELDARAAKQWVMADVAFHVLILRASGSERVAKIVSDLRIMTKIHGHNRQSPVRSTLFMMARTWAEHTRVYRALAARDGDRAKELLEKHIRIARNDAMAHFDQEQSLEGDGPDWPSSVRDLIGQMERYYPSSDGV